MRRIDWKVIVLLGIIVSVALGFLYGTGFLGGDTASPGSEDDPLVTAGYADSAIDRRMQEMETKIAGLEAKVQSLETEMTSLAGLPGGTGTGTGTGTAGGSGSTAGAGAGGVPAGTGTGTGTGTGATAVSEANVGKSAAVNSAVVNLRESASTSSNIKKKLSPSDTFTITKVDRDWYQVQLADGTVGWVAGYLVKLK